jgi:hypothetical protein
MSHPGPGVLHTIVIRVSNSLEITGCHDVRPKKIWASVPTTSEVIQTSDKHTFHERQLSLMAKNRSNTLGTNKLHVFGHKLSTIMAQPYNRTCLRSDDVRHYKRAARRVNKKPTKDGSVHCRVHRYQ